MFAIDTVFKDQFQAPQFVSGTTTWQKVKNNHNCTSVLIQLCDKIALQFNTILIFPLHEYIKNGYKRFSCTCKASGQEINCDSLESNDYGQSNQCWELNTSPWRQWSVSPTIMHADANKCDAFEIFNI